MALKPFYENSEAVPAELAEHYVEAEDGKYSLAVEQVDGYSLENVAGLKSTLGKLKERSQQAENALRPYAELGKDAQTLASDLSDLESLREAQGNESEQVTALKNSMEALKVQSKAELEKQIAPYAEKLDARTNQLKELTIANELRKAIVEAGGNPHLLVPALISSVKAEESDDGRINPVVVDTEGTPRVVGADLAPMSFNDLVDEIKQRPEYQPAFEASGASGGGTNAKVNSNNARGQLTPDQAGQLSMAEYRKAKSEGLIS